MHLYAQKIIYTQLKKKPIETCKNIRKTTNSVGYGTDILLTYLQIEDIDEYRRLL